MGGINLGGGSGKKSLDAEIPLVPFIDLLLCCIMFLLVTAAWNQLARINANQQTPGPTNVDTPPPPESVKLILQVRASGYVLATTGGDPPITIPKTGSNYDLSTLLTRLRDWRNLDPNKHDITIAPEDGVLYADVVAAMDAVVGNGFDQMNLSDGSSL